MTVKESCEEDSGGVHIAGRLIQCMLLVARARTQSPLDRSRGHGGRSWSGMKTLQCRMEVHVQCPLDGCHGVSS